MKQLLLMRHSHAVSDNPAFSDHERPLSDAGRKLAVATARVLTEFDIRRIVCSSARRTQETAELTADICKTAAPIAEDRLYLADSRAYYQAPQQLAQADDASVLVVGHNPGIANLINTWADIALAIMPGTVAVFRLQIESWGELAGEQVGRPVLTQFIADGVRRR